MSRLTRRVRSDVPPMILKLLNLEEVPTECIEVVGTNSKPCDEVCGENQCSSCVLSAVFEKLAHYEDLEEQGLLLELPCKVGDTLYQPRKNYINEYKLIGLVYDIVHNEWIYEVAFQCGLDWTKTTCSMACIGKTVFLTKEEAEAKLAELKGTEE